jgi:hypothetical protein
MKQSLPIQGRRQLSERLGETVFASFVKGEESYTQQQDMQKGSGSYKNIVRRAPKS